MPFEPDENQPVSTQAIADPPVSAPGFKPDAVQPLGEVPPTKKILLADRNVVAEVPAGANAEQIQESVAVHYENDPAEAQGFFPELEGGWRSRGKINFFELGRRRDLVALTELIPFVGTGIEATESVALMGAVNRLKKNEYVDTPAQKAPVSRLGGTVAPITVQTAEEHRQADVDALMEFMVISEEERVRGYTWGGKVASGVAQLPAFIGEFLSTGGMAAFGKQVAKSTILKGTKAAVRATADDFARKIIVDVSRNRVTQFGGKVAGVAAGATTRSPAFLQYAANKYAQDRVNGSLQVTEKGELILKDMEEKPYTTAMKAYMDTYIELLSEAAGPGIRQVVAGTIPAKIATKLAPLMKKFSPGKTVEELFTRAGISGFLEEWGEERLGGFLRAVLGVEDFGAAEGSGLFGKIVASIPKGEDALVEVGVLAFPQGARLGVSTVFDFREAREKKTVEARRIREQEELAPDELAPELEEELPIEELPEEVTEIPEEETTAKFVEEIRKEREEVEVPPETPEELRIRQAEEVVIVGQERKELQKLVGKVRRTKSVREETKAISKSFFTTNPKAPSFGERAQQLGMTQEELVDLLQEITVADVGTAEQVREAKKVIRSFERKTRRAAQRQAIRDKIKAEKGSVEAVKRELIDFAVQTLEREDRGRKEILTKIKNVKTFPDLDKALIRIEEIQEASARRFLKGEIKEALATAKVTKQAGKPVGKFDADTQELLDMARDAFRLSKEQAQTEIQANLREVGDEIPTPQQALRNRMLSIAAGTDEATSSELAEALFTIQSLKFVGRLGNELRQMVRRRRNEAVVAKFVDVITGGKGLDPTARAIGVKDPDAAETLFGRVKVFIRGIEVGMVSWDDVMDMISRLDKTSKPNESFVSVFSDVFDVTEAERKGTRLANQEMRDMVVTSYGVTTEREIIDILRNSTKQESLGTFRLATGQRAEIIMSRSQARKKWMEMQDPTLQDTFLLEEGMGWTTEIMNAVENFLSTEDKKFAQAQLDFYREYYKGVNDVYRVIFGVNLPFNEFYSPIKRSDIDRDLGQGFGEFMHEINVRRQVTSGSLKSRVANLKPLELTSDTSVLTQHVAEMERFKNWVFKIRDLNMAFGDARVTQAIVENHGSLALKVIKGFIQDFTRGGVRKSALLSWIDQMRINFTRAALAIRPSILIKQLSSFPAFAVNVPTHEFVAGVFDFWFGKGGPIAKVKILRETEFLQARGQNIDRDIKAAIATDAYSAYRKTQSALNMTMLNVQLGDQGAIVVGGWALYRHVLKQTSSKEKALRAFGKISTKTQQSGDVDLQSFFQRLGAIGKLFTMFKSTQNQYFRLEIGAVRNYLAGREGLSQTAKTLAIVHFILPMLFQYVVDFFRFDPEHQRRAAIFGSLNGLFIVGDMLDFLLRSALGMKKYDPQVPITTVTRDGAKIIDALSKLQADDFTDEDMVNLMKGTAGLGGFAIGQPVEGVGDMFAGVRKLYDGEYRDGLGGILGWSEFSLQDDSESSDKRFRR